MHRKPNRAEIHRGAIVATRDRPDGLALRFTPGNVANQGR